MVPESINEGYRRAGIESPRQDARSDIWMYRFVDWPAVPRKGDEVDLQMEVDPRLVNLVEWAVDGSIEIWLSDFDTDEVGSEFDGVEALLEAGWSIDVDP